jgi:hypothetical protein
MCTVPKEEEYFNTTLPKPMCLLMRQLPMSFECQCARGMRMHTTPLLKHLMLQSADAYTAATFVGGRASYNQLYVG